jgi:hypothetical protein
VTTVKVRCEECGKGMRNHRVVVAHEESWTNDEDGEKGGVVYQVVQCLGCDTFRFRQAAWSTYDIDPETGQPDWSVEVYPEHVPNARAPVIEPKSGVPQEVERIYRETITALNAGALILSGAGLRAIVEAICINAKAPGGNLQQKIDGLVKLGLLAKTQADLLHEERYLGNAAVHEIEPPARSDVEDGLAIVESLLNTMYIAPGKAARLKANRAQKKAAKKAPLKQL